ncbi:MAG: caspase family protein, partial [Methylococcaceae bacterium]
MKNKLLKIGFLVASFSSVQVVWAQEKIALVIGNGIYDDKNLNLKNPVNDAKDMKAALEKVGFTVLYKENATAQDLDYYRDNFVSSLEKNKGSIGLFYYSGHGMQMDGVNYLIPADAKISRKVDLAIRGYNVGLIVGAMEEAENKANIVILDACRDNPLSKSVKSLSNTGKGLTNIDAQLGTLIAYATKSGSVANDNPIEKNSLYTKYLKQYLFQPGVRILDALTKVRNAVRKEEPLQTPSEENMLSDNEICLAGCDGSAVITQPTGTPPTISLISGADSVVKNKTYTIKFKATDTDGDLSKIDVQWGDGTANTSKAATNGATISFTHTYKFSGIQPLVASAIDKLNATSEFSKSVTVQEPVSVVKIPTVSNANASPSSIIYGNSITFNTKLNANLPTGYSVQIDYGNGLMQMNGSGASFSLSAKPIDLGSSLFTVGIYDNNGNLKSNQLTGNYSVSEPAP